MRYIAFDIATTSGWVYLDNDRIIERGTIQLLSQMDLPQKLHFFHLELKNILERLRPERAFIEDVFLGISGAKTLAYLARLNGVAISTAFEVLQEKVKLYEPTYWKSHSFDGLGGSAKKWQIQLAVIKHYNLPITGNFSNIDTLLIEQNNSLKIIKDEWNVTRDKINKLKSQLIKKRNPVTLEEKIYIEKELKENIKMTLNSKRLLKEKEKEFDKKFSKITIDITAQTGMTENICDACGIAYCGFKETINGTI
jgi:Holliday junction resolvasome RuvABC endonuclease subunit